MIARGTSYRFYFFTGFWGDAPGRRKLVLAGR
jgi:hypothetical protein